jgi:hypothetical protein
MVAITPAQVGAIFARLNDRATDIQIRRWAITGKTVEVSQFAQTRLIETAKIGPSGIVKVLS